MSFRARRLRSEQLAQPFEWNTLESMPDPALWDDGSSNGTTGSALPPAPASGAAPLAQPHGGTDSGSPPVPEPQMPSPAELQAHLAALEREAFTKGYAQGERAGTEAGAQRAEAMLRRLAQTLDDLTRLRETMIRETERQMVSLALTVARRIVDREISLDPDLVAALAHVALDRLGDNSPATIRLHPDDYAAVMAGRGVDWAGTQVSVVPDTAVARGGCLVESAFGMVDASVTAQIAELERALLGDRAEQREAGSDAA